MATQSSPHRTGPLLSRRPPRGHTGQPEEGCPQLQELHDPGNPVKGDPFPSSDRREAGESGAGPRLPGPPCWAGPYTRAASPHCRHPDAPARAPCSRPALAASRRASTGRPAADAGHPRVSAEARTRPRAPHPPAPVTRLRGAYLDALDALGDHVGVVHGHQRDLDPRHPAHGVRPHACGQRRPVSSVSPCLPRPRAPQRPPPGERPVRGQPEGRSEAGPIPPAQLTTQGVWTAPCSVSTAATRRTPKSSVRTRMPVTGQFSMTWEGEGLPPGALAPQPDGTGTLLPTGQASATLPGTGPPQPWELLHTPLRLETSAPPVALFQKAT